MIRDQIKTQLVDAMKAKDEAKTSILRMMNAAIKDRDIAARPSGKMNGITDDEILGLIQTMIKQRKESIDMYEKGNRPDLVAKEKSEIATLESFLPAQLNEAAMTDAIKAAIAQTGASSMKDMGAVMAALRGKYAGQMDFGKASAMIKGLLN